MLGAASAHDFGGIDSSQVEIFLIGTYLNLYL